MTASTRSARVIAACCSAHAIQDGLVALQFVLLPILAQTFGLSYSQVGLLRGLHAVALAACEVPSGMLAERVGARILLVLGLATAGLGYLGVAFGGEFFVIASCFVIAGIGGGFQHSLSSAVLAANFEQGARRRALGTYNAAGDAGKLTGTGLFGLGVGAGLAEDNEC